MYRGVNMKYMMIFITVLVLSSCRSDKTNTESSSSFIYDISTLTIALSHEYLTPAEGYFTHIDTRSDFATKRIGW